MKSGFAKADGAELYFERRGRGHPLLMIAGGGGDCGVYSAIGEILGKSYTVLTYDRRGNSRSPLRGPPTKIELAQQSADAVAVLRANGFESARVFGSSGGASIALDLAARHPEAVEATVPHEPPTPKLLPDAEQVLSGYDEIYRVMEVEGWEAAFKLFLEVNKLTPPGEPVAMKAILRPETVLPPGPLLDLMRRQSRNWEYMMKCEVRSFIDYAPDLDSIAKSRGRLALSAGLETRGQYFHRTSELIADRLGAEFVELPGGHSGAMEVPGPFAVKLRGLFERLGASD
jgi:pimeloyl-ACP methyl ester carboxylesterase